VFAATSLPLAHDGGPCPHRRAFDPEAWRPFAKGVAACMLCGLAIGVFEVGKIAFAETRGAANVPTQEQPTPTPISFAAEATSSAGTVATGYYRGLPYDRVDPNPPEPRVLFVDVGQHKFTFRR
jgi:hypothetical protein